MHQSRFNMEKMFFYSSSIIHRDYDPRGANNQENYKTVHERLHENVRKNALPL